MLAQKAVKKITVQVPKATLESAMIYTEKGITETVRKALEFLVAREACRRLSKLRGKLELRLSYQDIKEMRE